MMEDNNPQDKKNAESFLIESDKGKKKSKETKPERGIDTMFRTTLNNHNNLSGLVDNKANILLSVNAIIISVSLTTIIPKLDNPSNAHLIIPTLTLIISSVIAITFAILATRPSITQGSFTRKEVDEKKVNLLFFGNFYKMPYEDYNWAMNELMKDKDYVYNSMIKDLYHLGIVLEKKYRLLRVAYTIFMFGIIISVLAFLIAFKFR
ncbi:Pycsar system effector family protein [Flavobacterium sp. UBA7663]|uniref:Pycsar system effector family protein n=1 Tax=Flavobacterium sp. UBA7663 TaxID=1946557 RepID=UPI0032E47CF8